VEINYLGHPLDRPKDIRSRAFLVQWNTEDHKAPLEFHSKTAPIYRAYYYCNASHEWVFDDMEALELPENQVVDDLAHGDDDDVPGNKNKDSRRRCTWDAKLVASDDDLNFPFRSSI
jgi:hypothetical protein